MKACFRLPHFRKPVECTRQQSILVSMSWDPEIPTRTRAWIFLPQVLSCVLCVSCPLLAQESSRKDQTKRVWTNEELQRLASRPVANAPEISTPDTSPSGTSVREHYTRQKDPKWYVGQLQPLREQLIRTESELKALQQARKYGAGITGAVALDQEPEGVSPEGQLEVLQQRRAQLLRKIDELEEQARHNEIVPGELRTDRAPEEDNREEADTGTTVRNGRNPSPEAKELESAIAEKKEQLEHGRKEAELLQLDERLEKQQEYSNPEPPSRRNKQPPLVGIKSRLEEKQAEISQTEQDISELEDRLEDLRRNAPTESQTEADDTARTDSRTGSLQNQQAREAENEALWRKLFAAIDYKIRIAQTESDILQRELNLGSVQYYPNPATAMKESITRRAINEHRKAIEDKKKEIADLQEQRADLEDELRHAGGPAGWARE